MLDVLLKKHNTCIPYRILNTYTSFFWLGLFQEINIIEYEDPDQFLDSQAPEDLSEVEVSDGEEASGLDDCDLDDPVLLPLQDEEVQKHDVSDILASQVAPAELDHQEELPASQSSSVIPIEDSPDNSKKVDVMVEARENIQEKINHISMMLSNAKKKMASQCFSWNASKLFVGLIQKGFPPLESFRYFSFEGVSENSRIDSFIFHDFSISELRRALNPPEPKKKTEKPIYVPESLPFGGANADTMIMGDEEMELAAQNLVDQIPELPEIPELPKADLVPSLS